MKNSVFLIILIALPTMLACTCNHSKKLVDQKTEMISDEIIVQLKGKVSPKTLVGSYQKYKLEIIRPVDEDANHWLFTWDTDLIEPAEMLKTLKYSQFSTGAEFNSKLE